MSQSPSQAEILARQLDVIYGAIDSRGGPIVRGIEIIGDDQQDLPPEMRPRYGRTAAEMRDTVDIASKHRQAL